MTSWLNVTAIATGGALGAVCRYLVTILAMAIPGGSTMLGTTVANVMGCLLLGGFAQYSLIEGNLSPQLALACRVGFLGSLTTFSTFVAESTVLAVEDRWGWAAVYVLTNLILGWVSLVGAAELVKGYLS